MEQKIKKITLNLHTLYCNILHNIFFYDSEAERFNGWAAMLSFVAAVGAYVTTGQIILVGSVNNQIGYEVGYLLFVN